MNDGPAWMLYGATGYTGRLIAQHALARGHRPVLAGRNGSEVAALAKQLGLAHRVFPVDEPVALMSELKGMDLVLNAGGPFLHTATPLAEACIAAGANYLDISNELRVFTALFDMDERAKEAGVSVAPGAGFGVVATNFIAARVSELVGGAQHLEVASRVFSAQPGPGAGATMQANLPFGGWIRRDGSLVAQELFTGIVTLDFPDGPCEAMPVPTGDLEASYRVTGAPCVVAYAVSPPSADKLLGSALSRSFGWARATGANGSTATALFETGDSYNFTPASSIRAVEETLASSRTGALAPADAFGANFVTSIDDTSISVNLE
jgi:short subunit dehydrogenase-like uncharacterized protein